ncbi:MAG: OsmC family protein [Dehalococcoidia bacterium]
MTQISDAPRIRNGVNVDTMYGTLDAIKSNPTLATFQWRASNKWMGGSHNRTSIKVFYGAGGDDTTRSHGWDIDAGEPGILLGQDEGPNPAEFLLHALAACLTTSLVYVAAARKVELDSVESQVEGDMDVQGALGLNDEIRNGFKSIRVKFTVSSSAPREKVEECVARAYARSAVFDSITKGVPVSVALS